MVQLHALHSRLPAIRPTVDIDMILHIETGATTFKSVRHALEDIGYELQLPLGKHAPVHRFTRQDEQIDVMVADNLAPAYRPTVLGRPVFAVPAGTSALRKTVNCSLEWNDPAEPLTLSIPDALGALVLKGAAYREDPRDRSRHLDDAAILACARTRHPPTTDSKPADDYPAAPTRPTCHRQLNPHSRSRKMRCAREFSDAPRYCCPISR